LSRKTSPSTEVEILSNMVEAPFFRLAASAAGADKGYRASGFQFCISVMGGAVVKPAD